MPGTKKFTHYKLEDPNDPDEDIDESEWVSTPRKILHQNNSVDILKGLLLDYPDEYIACLIKRTKYNGGKAIPLKRHDIPFIHLQTTQCCGRTFDGDKVVVKIIHKEKADYRVTYFGSVEGILNRADDIYEKRFICHVDDQNCRRMVPMYDGSVRFLIKAAPLRFKNNKVFAYKRTDLTDKKFTLEEKSNEAANPNTNHRVRGKLFTVRFIKWSMYHWHPYGYVERKFDVNNKNYSHFKAMYDVPGKHSKEMNDLARSVVREKLGTLQQQRERQDLTNLFVFTIDAENAKVLDDGLSIEPCSEHKGKQCWKVGIHIADVASFIDKGHEIDKLAKKKLLSFMDDSLDEDAGRMLQPALEKQCSLLSNGKDCFAVSTFFHSSKPGWSDSDDTASAPVLSKIRPKRQLSYKEAQVMLNKGDSRPFHSATDENLPQQLYFLWHVMLSFRVHRLKAAAFYGSLSHTDYDFNNYHSECMARMLVEEAMITFNGFIANFLLQNKVSFVARPQPPPQEKPWKYSPLSVYQTSVAAFWKERYSSSNPDIQKKNHSDQTMTVIPEVWEKISSSLARGHVEEAILLACCDDKQPELVAGLEEFQRIQEKAILKKSGRGDISHFSLRLPSYTRCTSPIRRYLDLATQRRLVQLCKPPKANCDDADRDNDFYADPDVNGYDDHYGDDHEEDYDDNSNDDHYDDDSDDDHYDDDSDDEFDVIIFEKILKKENQAREYQRTVCFHKKLNENEVKAEYFAGYVIEFNDFEIVVKFPSLPPLSSSQTIRMSELIPKKKVPVYAAKDPGQLDKIYLQWSLRYYDQGLQNSGFCFEKRKTVKTAEWKKFISFFNEDSFLESSRDAAGEALQRVADSLADKEEEQPPSSVEMINKTSNGIWHGRKVEINITPCSKQIHSAIPLFVQFGIGLQDDFQTLVPQLLHLPTALGKVEKGGNLDICLSHRRNVTMFDVNHEEGTLSKNAFDQQDYLLYLYYQKWIPLVRMDGVYSSVHSNSAILLELNHCTFSDQKTLKGQFTLQNSFCDNCFIVIKKGDFLCFRERIINKENGKFHTWISHGVVSGVPPPSDKNVATSTFSFTLFESVETQPRLRGQRGPTLCELIPLSVPHRRMCNALNTLDDTSDLVKAICMDHIKSLRTTNGYYVQQLIKQLSIGKKPVGNFAHTLNDNQSEQIKRALGKPVTLIQGPPGTGKSFMGAHLAYYFCKLNPKLKKSGKVLYCGPSNKSVDVVAEYLMKFPELRIIRVYGGMLEELDFPVPVKPSGFHDNDATPITPDLQKVALHHVIRRHDKPYSDEIRAFDQRCKLTPKAVTVENYKEFLKLVNEAKTEELKENAVILCTCTVAGSPLISGLDFAQVIVDESGMCTEPECLVPIVAAAKNEDLQVTLIGDHKQLEPVLMCRLAAKQGLIKSMFEALKEHSQTLTVQYRMHPTICKFVSEEFYEGKLKNDKLVSSRKPGVLTYPVDNPENTAVFWDVRGYEEEDESKSKYNTKQAEVVIQCLVYLLTKKNVKPNEIMVLSPYLAQCRIIKKLVSSSSTLRRYHDHLHIGSVVTSQGSEANYVILSTVRSSFVVNSEIDVDRPWLYKHIGFVVDDHQINVAISRAKLGLYIIGNRRLLEKHSTWKHLLDSYSRRNAIYRHRKDRPLWESPGEDDDDDRDDDADDGSTGSDDCY